MKKKFIEYPFIDILRFKTMDAYTPPSTPTDSTTIVDLRRPPHIVRLRDPNAFQLPDPNSVLDPPGDDLDQPTARQLFF